MTTRDAVAALEPNHLMKVDFMTDDDFAGHTKNYEQLRLANSRYIHDLRQIGMEPDFTVGMLHTFFEGLVAVGALTKAQLLIIQLGWETTFHSQLQKMHEQAQEMLAAQEARARLAVPGGGRPKSLIVPGRG